MGLFADLKILYHLTLKPVRGKNHAARMENFYGGQAEQYDDFRRRLLQGREELWKTIECPAGGVWVDLGGGTGSNIEYLSDRIDQFSKVYVVDLSPSLLEVANERFKEHGWNQAEAVTGDATLFRPPEQPVDVVTFSYSLTMIPDWFAAIENALAMLKPGGRIGVVDFYVSRKFPADGLKRHRWFTRTFWPTWFASDNVFPSPDHVPFLHHHFETESYEELKCKIPYIPFLRMPYYRFVGRKRSDLGVVNGPKYASRIGQRGVGVARPESLWLPKIHPGPTTGKRQRGTRPVNRQPGIENPSHCPLSGVVMKSKLPRWSLCLLIVLLANALAVNPGLAQSLEPVPVEGQPLGANIERLIAALDYLGAPLDEETATALHEAAQARDATLMQQLLDPHVLLVVSLNPEIRVKVDRGPASGRLQQGGFTPVLLKVLNDSTVEKQLQIESPQSGPVYSGAALLILQRQAQSELNANENLDGERDRFLEVEIFRGRPMTDRLSGLEVEYAIALIYSSESGKREATIGFHVGGGTQDIGFRGEVPVLFDIRPAVPVRMEILDDDGTPTTGRLTFRDRLGHIYPPQAKRLAPDFFFQPQIYRAHDDVVLLPPGEFDLEYSRGPEYLVLTDQVAVDPDDAAPIRLRLKRWIDPMQFGFYCGDHHIHGAGCSHYDNPTQGVTPEDMFQQVKGEGLNVGCVLTWGPCFDFQRQYFSPIAKTVSEPQTLIKYDLEISGFGSAALGHVCLLNLSDQTYPGSDGTKTQGWPTWTVPVMRWAKEQGGFTGYPHSAMHVNASASAQRLIGTHDEDDDQQLSADEARNVLLPYAFDAVDADADGGLSSRELRQAIDRAADELPNLAVPEMNGAGAMEICVSAAEGVCDFISAMDTARIPEWNTWYHLMNCGLPIKLSGETDFPCMSSRSVGQGRVYVQLGDVDRVEFSDWCRGLAAGRSYVSDGYSHALRFSVDGQTPGMDDIALSAPGTVSVRASVAFAPRQPRAVAYGNLTPGAGRRMVGNTVNLHAPRNNEWEEGGERIVELVVNGKAVKRFAVPADGEVHDLAIEIPIEASSWVALRQFPQLHTNPVQVLVADQPIRASRSSALWCAETIKLLWQNRHELIAEDERDAAWETYQRAINKYEAIAAEAQAGS